VVQDDGIGLWRSYYGSEQEDLKDIKSLPEAISYFGAMGWRPIFISKNRHTYLDHVVFEKKLI
jgi:hypothetical protein